MGRRPIRIHSSNMPSLLKGQRTTGAGPVQQQCGQHGPVPVLGAGTVCDGGNTVRGQWAERDGHGAG